MKRDVQRQTTSSLADLDFSFRQKVVLAMVQCLVLLFGDKGVR